MSYGNSEYSGNTLYGGGSGVVTDMPVITLVHPQAGQEDVSPDGSIIFRLSAPNGLDETQFKVEIDMDDGEGFSDMFVYSDEEQFKNGYDGPLSLVTKAGNLYTVVIDPWVRFPEQTQIDISITAPDVLGNSAIIQ